MNSMKDLEITRFFLKLCCFYNSSFKVPTTAFLIVLGLCPSNGFEMFLSDAGKCWNKASYFSSTCRKKFEIEKGRNFAPLLFD